MAKKQETRIARTEPQRVARGGEPVPEWVTEGSAGFEGTNAQDLVLPRLMLTQALTPARQRKNPDYIDGLSEGDFFNSVTRENLGPGPHLVTPILCAKMRIKFVDVKKIGSGVDCMGTPVPGGPRNPEGIACRLNDGKGCLHAGLDDDEPCFLIYNFPVVLHDRAGTGPLVLSFRSTGVKVARAWLSMMKMRGKFPMYAMAFSLQSVDAANSKGEFKQVKIDNAGWTPREIIEPCRETYEAIRDRVILTDTDDAPEREAGDEEM